MTQPSTITLNNLIRRVSIRFGGSQARELERFIKFFIVGGIGFIVDFGTLNLLQLTVLPPDNRLKVILATSIAFTAAITSNFIWNRYWTYPDSRSRPILQQLAQFFIVNVLGWLFRLGIVVILYRPLGALASTFINNVIPGTVAGIVVQDQIGTNLAQAIAVFIVMFWNFFANRYWTYNDVEA